METKLRKWFKRLGLASMCCMVLFIFIIKLRFGHESMFDISKSLSIIHTSQEENQGHNHNLSGPNDPRDPRFYNIILENEALQFKPCQDINKTASTKYSTVDIHDRSRENYAIGDTIRAIVTLYDSNENRKKAGGDQIRATIENSTLKAAAPCIITDNLDGTHLVECEALWTGTSEIVVTLAYTREAITSLYRIRNEAIGTVAVYGVFKSQGLQETTMCHPNSTHLLRLTNYTELCNMTYINTGMPFFCGKPTKKYILCRNWKLVKLKQTGLALPISDCERKLLKNGHRRINKQLFVNVKSGNRKGRQITDVKEAPFRLCSKYNVSSLWSTRNPSGFFYNGTWHLLQCRGINQSSYMSCLKDKQVYLFGDSTTRAWYSLFIEQWKCQQTTKKWTKPGWHRASMCYNKEYNFSVGWYPHSQPFNTNDEAHHTQLSMARRIDEIPSNTHAIIVVHMYTHVLRYHHNTFRERMILVRKSIENFIARSKESVVMIKGPHTYAPGGMVQEYYGYVYSKILYDVFNGLHDRVVLLNNRDTSIASHSNALHPNKIIVDAMVNQMMSFACKY